MAVIQGRLPLEERRNSFCDQEFQTYLNKTLLKDWQVPKWKGSRAAATHMAEDSDFLQISESCALAWAHRLGLCYARRKKHYYVDGHDRPDVLAHRAKWLKKEGRLELRQYLWAHMPLAKALNLGEQGMVGDDFRALLENDEVTATSANASPTATGENVSANGEVSKQALQESLRNDMVLHYFGNEEEERVSKKDDASRPWVELHVDLLPSEMRKTYTATVNDLKMGDCLSVCFPEGLSAIVKIGGDKIITKMHSENKSYWEINNLKVISPKSEGKGNMKVVFVDEIVCLAGNCIPPQMMERFQRVRKRGYEFRNPMFVEWEYGKSGEDQGMGYWTSENMNKLSSAGAHGTFPISCIPVTPYF